MILGISSNAYAVENKNKSVDSNSKGYKQVNLEEVGTGTLLFK